jgi:predicted alpha/beta superfamily hydrolase
MFATVLKYMYFCTIIEKILHNMRNFKKTIAVFSFFFCLPSPGIIHAQTASELYLSSKIETFLLPSRYFPFDRKIDVILPTGYDLLEETQDFNVIYVFDGQTREYPMMAYAMPAFVNLKYGDKSIIVAVHSPSSSIYSRQDDFLPDDEATKARYHGHGGYADALGRFVSEELFPYINSHYHTNGHNLAIGHSLGASFLLHNLVTRNIFDHIIAISPNFAYGNQYLAKEFIGYDFNQKKAPKFLFISDAGEERIQGWSDWKPARETIDEFVAKGGIPKSTVYTRRSYLDYDHMSSFVPALRDALSRYYAYRDSLSAGQSQTKETYHKHLELIVPKGSGEVYITGNQTCLKNWNPKGVKMKQVSDTLRVIDVDVQLPVYFKFTQGSWQTEAVYENSYSYQNQFFESKTRESYCFKIDEWEKVNE